MCISFAAIATIVGESGDMACFDSESELKI